MTTTLHLVLADSELELVPAEAAAHAQVRKHARSLDKRAAHMLLDSSHHHAAIRGMPDGDRRGRPDLVHLFLLTALESRLNKAGLLRVSVHTRHDRLVTIDPTTRLVRHYPRFVGLMEQLFAQARVPKDGPTLMAIEENVTLAEAVKRTGALNTVALDNAGEKLAPGPFTRGLLARTGDACVVVGGFPSGDFRSDVKAAVQTIASFGPESLAIWTVAGEVLAHAGEALVDKA